MLKTQQTPGSCVNAASPRAAEFSLRSLVLPFYVPAFLASTAMGLVMPLLPLYAGTLGAGAAIIGLVVGMHGLGSLVANIPAGRLAGCFGKRRTMLLAVGLDICGALAAALAPNALVLAPALLLMGGAHALFFVSRLTFFRELVPTERRGRALALLGGEYRFGSFLGPIAGGFMAGGLGYTFVFAAFCLLMGVAGLVVYLFVPRDGFAWRAAGAGPLPRQRGAATDGLFVTLGSNSRVFLTAGLAIILLQLVRAGRQVLLPLWGSGIGLGIERIGLAIGLMYLVEMFFFYPAGIVMDRLGRKWAAVPCLLIMSLSLSLLPLAVSWPLFLLVCAAAGVGNGLGSGINMTLSTDFAPKDNPGAFIGVWRFIVDGGTAAGPLVVGIVTAAAALGPSALVVAGAGLAGAMVMGFGVRETARSRGAALAR